jgi:hypothetical protein
LRLKHIQSVEISQPQPGYNKSQPFFHPRRPVTPQICAYHNVTINWFIFITNFAYKNLLYSVAYHIIWRDYGTRCAFFIPFFIYKRYSCRFSSGLMSVNAIRFISKKLTIEYVYWINYIFHSDLIQLPKHRKFGSQILGKIPIKFHMKNRKIEKLTIFRAPYLGGSPTSYPWSIMHTDPPTRIVRIKTYRSIPASNAT